MTIEFAASATGRQPVGRLALAVSVLLLVILYGLEPIIVRPEGGFNVTYYDELAEAFLAGQTYLLRSPPADLLALPDPWDPIANRAFREVPEQPGNRFLGVHDLTLYHGRFYLEWGAFPALVLIPLRWLAGGDLPLGDVVLAVEFLAGLAGAPPSRSLCFATAPLFVLCPLWAWLLRRIAVYEVAVFFAQLCIGLALLATIIAFEREAARPRRSIGWVSLSFLLG